MQLRADLALKSAIKSLTDVVLPALDSGNAPAQEQLQVVIGLLSLLAARLPLQFEYDRDELARLLEFARALDAADVPHRDTQLPLELGASIAAAGEVLDRAQTTPEALLLAVRDLRAMTGAAVSAQYAAASAAQRATLTRLVLAHADAQIVRERAWVIAQGWEADPALIPSIERLLR